MKTIQPVRSGAVLMSILLCGMLRAQTSPVHTGSIEVGAFGGAQFGDVAGVAADVVRPGFRISGTTGAGGGLTIGVAISRRLLFEAEASFADGGGRQTSFVPSAIAFNQSVSLIVPFQVQTSTRAWIYEADLDVRLPSSKRPNFVPYFSIGGATIQGRSDALVTFSAPPALGIPSTALSARFRQATFAPVLVAGIRKYVTPKFGFRIEVKGYFPTSGVHEPFGRASAGIFFQFK